MQSDAKLDPRRPPGRSNRKARAFATEIARLHLQGYTCEVIREALLDAGVAVSKSTVQREIARLPAQAKAAAWCGQAGSSDDDVSGPSPPRATSSPLPNHDLRSGKDIAASFVMNHITNPLMRTRSRDEDSSH